MKLDLQEVEVGVGWRNILLELDADLTKIDPNFKYVQIKEKFGGLRVYVESSQDRFFDPLWDRIREAERRSYKTCEVCGHPGELRGGGWLKTLCEAHAEGKKMYDERKLLGPYDK